MNRETNGQTGRERPKEEGGETDWPIIKDGEILMGGERDRQKQMDKRGETQERGSVKDETALEKQREIKGKRVSQSNKEKLGRKIQPRTGRYRIEKAQVKGKKTKKQTQTERQWGIQDRRRKESRQEERRKLRESESGRKKKPPIIPPLSRDQGLYSSIHYLKA